MRLFANEKRTELLKIKVKPSVLKKAIEAWYVCYPNSEEPNFDDMFQEMIIEVAKSKNLIGVNDLPEKYFYPYPYISHQYKTPDCTAHSQA